MSSSQTRPARTASSKTSHACLRASLFVLVALALWSMIAMPLELPPYNWIEDYRWRHDRVVKHRPGLKNVPE